MGLPLPAERSLNEIRSRLVLQGFQIPTASIESGLHASNRGVDEFSNLLQRIPEITGSTRLGVGGSLTGRTDLGIR